jgi:hypothetical protein
MAVGPHRKLTVLSLLTDRKGVKTYINLSSYGMQALQIFLNCKFVMNLALTLLLWFDLMHFGANKCQQNVSPDAMQYGWNCSATYTAA